MIRELAQRQELIIAIVGMIVAAGVFVVSWFQQEVSEMKLKQAENEFKIAQLEARRNALRTRATDMPDAPDFGHDENTKDVI